MPPPDLIAAFNKLAQMVGNDMKDLGSKLGQCVAEIQSLRARLTALEQRAPAVGHSMPPAQVVNGEVIPDGNQVFRGDPNAFYKGDDDA